MIRKLEFKIPPILARLSEDNLIAAVPEIELRQIYWDDLNVGDSVIFEVVTSQKMGLVYCLLTGSYNPIYYQREGLQRNPIIPSGLVMGFISAVGGCYLGGKNIFLVQKRKSFFFSPIPYGSKLLVQGTILRKFRKKPRGKSRYYADFCQTVEVQREREPVRVVETGAIAGILKKSRQEGESQSEYTPHIRFRPSALLEQLVDAELHRAIPQYYQRKPFGEIQVGEVVKVRVRISHKMVLLFALLSGDYNPLHTSPEFAKKLSAFGGRNIAHGALLNALFSGQAILELLGAGYRVKKRNKAVFERAVKVGDTIIVRLEILDRKSEKLGKREDFYVSVKEELFIEDDSLGDPRAAWSSSTYQFYDF